MLDSLKQILGMGPAVDYAQLVKKGAIILDVRSRGEFTSGHIPGAINIPVDQLASNLARLPKDKTIITCCLSGGRSASARNILLSNGYQDVHNGGAWSRLKTLL